MSDTITKILSEFSVPTLVANENGPTSAEIAMAEEIARLRAENDHLRRVGMGRPSAELHEAALAELRAENERLRAEVARYRAGLQEIVDADGWWDAPSLARHLLNGKSVA